MSKANYGNNSSGTGSFPNLITVNRIIVQMNVNSSTIIVQVEYCVTSTLPGGVVAVSPQLFVFLFIIISGRLPYMQLQSTTQNLDHRMK